MIIAISFAAWQLLIMIIAISFAAWQFLIMIIAIFFARPRGKPFVSIRWLLGAARWAPSVQLLRLRTDARRLVIRAICLHATLCVGLRLVACTDVLRLTHYLCILQ